MSIKVYELIDSMSGSITNESEGGEVREVQRRYVIGRCPNGFNQVVDEIYPYCPNYVAADAAGIFWRRSKLDVKGIGNALFDISATYVTLQPKPPEDSGGEPNGDFVPGSIAWDTTGHNEHITQGLEEESRYPEGAPDFHSALNVSGESVQGLDVVRPNLRYSETWILPVQLAMNCSFVGAVYKLTGTVNLNQFRCFDPGEALFMGGRAQWNGDQPYVSATFDWECRPNVTDFYVKGIAAFPKEGWEHVWIMYQPDTSAGSIIRKPAAAYKNRVFPKKSWNALGMIGQQIGKPRAGANPVGAAAGGNGFP